MIDAEEVVRDATGMADALGRSIVVVADRPRLGGRHFAVMGDDMRLVLATVRTMADRRPTVYRCKGGAWKRVPTEGAS